MKKKCVLRGTQFTLSRMSPEAKNAAPIHVFEPLTSHRESDEAYPVIARLSDTVRVIECKDGLQWILQRRYGDQWKGVAYCRTRRALIREAKSLASTNVLLALPEHHDGFVEVIPRCKVCGRIKTKPTGGLPRHMFCAAMLKRSLITLNKTEAA